MKEFNKQDDHSDAVFTPKSKARTNKVVQRKMRGDSSKENYEKSSSKMTTSGHKPYNLDNESHSSPEPLSSRLEGEKMMVYQTENMQEKYLEELNKIRSQYQKHCNEAIIVQVSGDKQVPSERATFYEETGTPSIEYIRNDEENKSITEFDWRESKLTKYNFENDIDIIENESFKNRYGSVVVNNSKTQSKILFDSYQKALFGL